MLCHEETNCPINKARKQPVLENRAAELERSEVRPPLFLFFYFGCAAWHAGMQNLNSPTRYRTREPCSGSTESNPDLQEAHCPDPALLISNEGTLSLLPQL